MVERGLVAQLSSWLWACSFIWYLTGVSFHLLCLKKCSLVGITFLDWGQIVISCSVIGVMVAGSVVAGFSSPVWPDHCLSASFSENTSQAP